MGKPGNLRVHLLAGSVAAASASASTATFSPAEIAEWRSHSFVGETQYQLVWTGDRAAIHARCSEASASGLFRRESVDLTETPVLEWRWRVSDTYGRIDETVKAGDDYPARIYVVDQHPVLPWRTRALAYVWSSAMPEGADWVNAYTEAVRMVAVESGQEAVGRWRTERRNVRADFRRYHGRDIEQVDAIAIMSDCDNTGQMGQAWFGPIRLRSG